MSQKKRFPRLIWGFLLVVISFTGLSYFAGGSRVAEELVRRKLLQFYGLSETQLDRISFDLPGGWRRSSLTHLESPPHQHDLPTSYSVVETGVSLVFAQMGDGPIAGSDQRLQTTIELLEDDFFESEGVVSGVIEFYDDNGNPLELTLNGATGSAFPFQLNEAELARFTTAGSGELKTGWVHVHSDQPISGSLSFGIRDSQENVLTDVGVPASVLGNEFTIFADSIGSSRTGVAASNPSVDQSLDLVFTLNRSDGSQVAVEERTLVPRGHLAIFLDELFSTAPGIDEFEGSVVIRSGSVALSGSLSSQTAPGSSFAAVTLRSTGSLLTSLPALLPPPAGCQQTKLVIPHVGDGVFGGLRVVTSVVLFNNTPNPASGMIEFFNSDTSPLEVTIDGETNSLFDFAILGGGVLRLQTSGTGVGVGWAQVTMDQPLGGSGIFQVLETGAASAAAETLTPAGALVAEVGVAATPLFRRFRLIVSSLDPFNTGLAVAVPQISPSDELGAEVNLNLSLRDRAGNLAAFSSIKVPRGGHTSRFLTEIFNPTDFPNLDIREFDGSLSFSRGERMAPLALRSAGAKLTSTPTLLTRLNQFRPVSTLDVAQNLSGSSPAIRWLLHQNDNDFALEKVRISAPELGLNTDGLGEGSRLAFGYLALGANTRTLELLVRGPGGVDFDTVITKSDGVFVQARGRMEGTPDGGLIVELTLLGKEPFTEVADDADQEFFFPSGLIQAPASSGPVTITTEFTSVSTDPSGRAPIVRRTTQEIVFALPDAQKANLEAIAPQFPQPGRALRLGGTNLGDAPIVLFPMAGGETVSVPAARDEEDVLIVGVPAGLVDGAIRVDNGQGPGNPHQAKLLFSPRFQLGLIETEEELLQPQTLSDPTVFFDFEQDPAQFVLERFSVELYDVDVPLAALAIDSLVGGGVMTQGFNQEAFDLKVSEAEEDRAVLVAVSPLDPTQLSGQTLTVQKVRDGEGAPLGLVFTYVPDSLAQEPVMLEPPNSFELRFDLAGFPIQLPPSGAQVLAAVSMWSGTTNGADSGLEVEAGRILEIP